MSIGTCAEIASYDACPPSSALRIIFLPYKMASNEIHVTLRDLYFGPAPKRASRD